ncbi:MAG: 16S rRNA (adenine(1518)-N(6)/adenine(1519)-N(6))-dimethyltransferase RsmA [Pseudomonadota bacterium]|nr:16S rRNA (adenine(1518)-N(6)/adenine(1519)-N(6))-dimethyltransferase RsmA [Pseudomonadota bacterium]MEC8726935.1 16S rRNA (adenine(1518)-N(6)/adenine(1519)-N(6))-dimethyltransferase RsmA [Pseudomonadota bacterium]
MTGKIRIKDLPPLREVIASHDLSARKSLGQNFLLDLNILRRIARAAGPLVDKTVIEIGPGPGGLTRCLLETSARHIIAVEHDPRCINAIRDLEYLAPDRLRIIEKDAMNLDLDVLEKEFGNLCIIANLPYNIATSLLIRWLKRIELFDGLFLMFQREVAERIVAAPGSKTYGRLSVAAQWRCEVKPLFTLPARAFTPSPKIESTFVEFIPRKKLLAEAPSDAFETVVAAAFSQRRKMLRTSLKAIFSDPVSVLQEAGIDPTSRAEAIEIQGFCALARAFASQAR